MTKYEAKMEEGKAGIFSIEVKQCPLKVHTQALGQKPPICVGGIMTNIQGPVILNTCKHCHKETGLVSEDKKLFVQCSFPEIPA